MFVRAGAPATVAWFHFVAAGTDAGFSFVFTQAPSHTTALPRIERWSVEESLRLPPRASSAATLALNPLAG
jgi:hypothetical protein